MSRVILVDPLTGGHHFSYIRCYFELFREIGCNVSILTTDVIGVSNYLLECFPEQRQKVEVYKINRRLVSSFEKNLVKKDGLIADLFKSYYAFKDFWDIRKVIVSNKLDGQALIFILWLDAYLTKGLPAFLVDMVLPHDFAGLYFHPSRVMSFLRDNQNTRDILHVIPTLKSTKLRFVGVFDHAIKLRLKEVYQQDIFNVLPDIAEAYPFQSHDRLIRNILSCSKGRKIISLVGSLDKRKNLLTFFRTAKETEGNVFFVCVGKLSPEWFSASELKEIKEIANSCVDRLFFYNGYVASDAIFDSLISISAVLFAAYVNFPSSSNMIYKSALHKIPIIVSADHLMGEQVEDFELGIVLEDVTPENVLRAIYLLLEENKSYGFERFLEAHSREKLKTKLIQLL